MVRPATETAMWFPRSRGDRPMNEPVFYTVEEVPPLARG